MEVCAHEIGGIVLPPIHLGPDRALLGEDGLPYYGMDILPETEPLRQMIGSCYWVSPEFFRTFVDKNTYRQENIIGYEDHIE
jgi:hypothetical protein